MIPPHIMPIALGMVVMVMSIWLSLVAVVTLSAFAKWRTTDNLLRKQMLYLWLGPGIVFFGDLLHAIALCLVIYTGDLKVLITIWGVPFEFWTFSIAFDYIVFNLFFTFFVSFMVARYQEGHYKLYHKCTICIGYLAILLILPGLLPNIFKAYTFDYLFAIWAPHTILFFILGFLTTKKLIEKSRYAINNIFDSELQRQERSLYLVGICFAFSFFFYGLTSLFLPLNPMFGVLMIPKSIVYIIAFRLLLRDIINKIPSLQERA